MDRSQEGLSRLSNEEGLDIHGIDDDSEKGLLSSSPVSPASFDSYIPAFVRSDRGKRWSSITPCQVLLTILNVVLFLISILFFISPFSRQICKDHISDQDHFKATSFFSPILERFDIPKVTVENNGSLYDTYPPSILRQPYGDEADDEWYRIGTGVFPIVISSEDVLKVGKDPETAVKIPEEFGYGPDAFLAQTDVFHQLHCLELLHKEASYDQYYSDVFGDNPTALHKAHISHCIDLLAQSIKCNSNVDMIMFNWVEGWDQPFPDFETTHVCRDFEALLAWVNENAVPVDVFQAMTEPPPGYVRLPEPAPEEPPKN